MRTPFTGVGTALVTPFTSSGAVDEAGGPPPGAAADRRGRALPRALRHDRRGADALGGGEAPRGRARGGGGGGPRSRPRRGRRLRHPRGRGVGPRDARGGGRRPPLRHPLLQQAHAGGPLPPLPGDRGGDTAPDRRLQRAGADRLQRGPGDPRPPRVDPARGRGEGSLRQHDPDLRGAEGGRPATSSSSPGDDALTLPAMAVGARGVISVASNEAPGEMARLVEAAERNDFAAAREIHARLLPLMLANFAESNPIPVKAAMAQMGLLEENYRLPMVPPRRADAGEAPPGPRRASASCPRGPARERRPPRPARPRRAALRRGRRRRPRGGARRLRRAARGALARRGPRGRARPRLPHRLAGERLGQAGHPPRLPPRRPGRRLDGPRPPPVLRQGHAPPEAPRRSPPGCASSPEARRCATAPSSAGASSACPRCT